MRPPDPLAGAFATGYQGWIPANPFQLWLDANGHVENRTGVAEMEIDRALVGLTVDPGSLCPHHEHVICGLLADMARDLNELAAAPAEIAADLATTVYPDPTSGLLSTTVAVKQAALGGLIATALGMAGLADFNVFAAFVGVAGVAACPDPDHHVDLYESTDPALGRMLLPDVAPTELTALAGVCRQLDLAEERLLEAELAQATPEPSGIAAAVREAREQPAPTLGASRRSVPSVLSDLAGSVLPRPNTARPVLPRPAAHRFGAVSPIGDLDGPAPAMPDDLDSPGLAMPDDMETPGLPLPDDIPPLRHIDDTPARGITRPAGIEPEGPDLDRGIGL